MTTHSTTSDPGSAYAPNASGSRTDYPIALYDGHAADPASSLARNLLHGALAGVAGTWALDRVDWFFYDREPAYSRLRTWWVRPGGEDPGHVIATRVERALGASLTGPQHYVAGQAVHYLAGVLPAVVYGAVRPRVPALGAGRGLLFGVAGFFVDLLGTPAAGVAARPGAYPWQVHARSFAAHLVYGLVTDAALRALERRARRRDRQASRP